MKLVTDIFNFLLGEQSEPKLASRPRSIANAIKERHPVTFFYNGPRGQVQPGRRIKAEMVALGLSKKGNMVVRAWVAPPSRSKTGFEKGNWRTFIVSRMSQIEIFDDETFDVKRPGYNEKGDNSMSVVYAMSNWTDTPEPKQDERPQPEPQPQKTEPTPQPEPQSTDQVPEPQTSVEPQSDELPQPEPENTPSIDPPVGDEGGEEEENNYDELNETIKRIKELLYN